MNRLYAALSQVNGAVARAASRDELFTKICYALVHFGGFQMAWVGWIDQTRMRVVPVAEFGDHAQQLRQELFADTRPGHGLLATAIHEGQPYICNDILADPEALSWHQVAIHSGWQSMAVFPIRQENRVEGTLTVYARQQGFFGGQERALIEEAASDVSFGLDILNNDQRRENAEKQLARVNAELEQRIKERTAQLVEANANLQTFAYTAAHDLRAPLRAIGSFSDIVVEQYGEKLGPEGQSLLGRVSSSAGQMTGLLNDLLEYSKISNAELKLEPMSLEQAVKDALALLEGEIRRKNADIRVSEPLPEVIGHPATVVLLINNLLSNALKFVPNGLHPQIHFWAESFPDVSDNPSMPSSPHQVVRLSVKDNGIGIDPKDLEKIFGVFQRLHGKEAFPGTGLGLAIVRKGAERMGGRVGAESDPGKGSRFWLELNAATGV